MKISPKYVEKEYDYQKMLAITGGKRIKPGAKIIEMGGEYFIVYYLGENKQFNTLRFPTGVIKHKDIPDLRFMVMYAVAKGHEYIVVEKYRKIKRKKILYKLFEPVGRPMWIPKTMADGVLKVMMDTMQYEYSPDGTELNVITIKPHPFTAPSDTKYVEGLDDMLGLE